MKRIPTLDGWRGIAILMVTVAHAQEGLFNGHAYHDLAWLIIGLHGVAIFFVLSGYLITTRLLSADSIDLKAFYVRRFFRLMPTAWAYLACIGLLAWIMHVDFIGSDAVACIFFFRNIWPVHETMQS